MTIKLDIESILVNPVFVGKGYFDQSNPSEQPNPTYIAGPIQENAISLAEEQLGVSFPEIYREFLSKYGAILGSGFAIAGLDQHENNFFLNVVQQTELYRSSVGADADQHHLVLSDDGMSLHFIMDSSAKDKDAFLAFGPGYDYEPVAENFNDFCIQLSIDGLFSRL